MKSNNTEAGFSYIDVMIAVVILMVGILALLSGMSGAVLQAKGRDQQMLAKQTAASTMESIMSVKETDPARLGWSAVGNVGSNPVGGVPQGIFVTGFQPVEDNAGPDEVLGTADDTGAVVTGLQRRIVITDVCDPDRPSYNCPTPGVNVVRIRSVEVTVRYFIGALSRDEVITTVLTDYALVDE
jgi:type II secretory pathway pseudopilin PulG